MRDFSLKMVSAPQADKDATTPCNENVAQSSATQSMQESINPQKQEVAQQTNALMSMNGKELLEMQSQSIDMLVDGLIQRVGLVSLIGSSDTGKSSLLRQLACCVVGGQDFLGMKTAPMHHRAIYVSSEDESGSLSVLLKKQNNDLKVPLEQMEGLQFVFDTYKLLETLEQAVLQEPCDLIIIDAFADIFSASNNLYNTAEVRSFLQDYALMAQRHRLAILFLHHTAKRSDSLQPSKHNALGSQGFEAKMRLVLELKVLAEDASERYLCIDKGNYLPYEQKQKAMLLHFTDNLTFHDTGKRVPITAIGQKVGSDLETLKNEVETIEALHEQGHSYEVVADELGTTVRTIQRKKTKLNSINKKNSKNTTPTPKN